MKRFAAAEATMEQRAEEQQLELLMLTADEVTPRLFDVATRAEIVNLLKSLLSDRLSLVATPAETDDD
jgi:ABC-type microcin C transport system duplicated ATPase subunit YejF